MMFKRMSRHHADGADSEEEEAEEAQHAALGGSMTIISQCKDATHHNQQHVACVHRKAARQQTIHQRHAESWPNTNNQNH